MASLANLVPVIRVSITKFDCIESKIVLCIESNPIYLNEHFSIWISIMAFNFVIDYLLTVKSESDRGMLSKLTLLLDFLVIFMTNFSDFIINDTLLHSCDGIVSIVVIWCSETITIIIIWVPAQPDKTLVNKFTNIGYKWYRLFKFIQHQEPSWWYLAEGCYCDKMICEALCWLSYDIIIVQQFCKSVNWIT